MEEGIDDFAVQTSTMRATAMPPIGESIQCLQAWLAEAARLQKRGARRFDSVANASTVTRQPMAMSAEDICDPRDEETEESRVLSKLA